VLATASIYAAMALQNFRPAVAAGFERCFGSVSGTL
jgi:hypothetical protein